MDKYGERLKTARKAKGLTQTELAMLLGITQKSYQRMETGVHDLKMSTIYQLCKVLNISADWLLGLKVNTQYSYDQIIPVGELMREHTQPIATFRYNKLEAFAPDTDKDEEGEA